MLSRSILLAALCATLATATFSLSPEARSYHKRRLDLTPTHAKRLVGWSIVTKRSTSCSDTAPESDVATSSTSVFPPLAYADGQISDGTAGDAQAQANAVCVTPFAGLDLSTVSASDLKNLQTFREAAESAETDQFDPEIEAATGAAATALQNGKIKNKVLKLTCEIQGLQIEQAQGSDETSDIATEQTKLNSNIALDTKASGQASKGVV